MEHLNTLTQLAPIIGGSLAGLTTLLHLAASVLQRHNAKPPAEEKDGPWELSVWVSVGRRSGAQRYANRL